MEEPPEPLLLPPVPEPEPELEDAGAAGAAVGVVVLVVLVGAVVLLVAGAAAVVLEASPFFVLAYRSEPQPPPLSWKLVRLIWRSSAAAWHFGHWVGLGSLTLCITSSSFPHFAHLYS